ncbi:hypothetical protein [Odoribacter laneus]|uniref:hypothetical protein n=1 Tax=Odoribacter laneus TaxID=626933 RepID=UPI002659C219|nr:hypothetical protein [Odoribacter laneus]
MSCDDELIAKYHKFVLPYFEKMALNGKQICTLTQLRDALLAKLLKREIEIKGM